MNKADLINALAERNGITKKEADKAVSSVLEIIEEALKNGDKVQAILSYGPRSGKLTARILKVYGKAASAKVCADAVSYTHLTLPTN